MRVGILSDTHSRHQIVQKALDLLKQQNIDLVLHCGDIEDIETVQLFRGFTTHFVFGNCDCDKPALRQAIAEMGAILHEPFGQLELNGIKIAWTHGDDKRLLRDLEENGRYHFVFYGHSHQAEQHQSGATVVANPGALHRARPKTFLILDLASRKLTAMEVPDQA
jgi:putative phosphoesterase